MNTGRGFRGWNPRLLWIGFALVLLALLYQTYEKAYRVEGYDLNAYLFASRALWTGGNPYQDGAFPYIYPLFLALAISPLLALPMGAAHLVWFALSACALVGSARILARLAFSEKSGLLPFACLFVLLFDSIQSNFLNGQVNLIVLYLCLKFYEGHEKGRNLPAALSLGAAIALKIMPGILLFFLVFRSRFRTAFLAALWAVAACLLPWLVVGERLWGYYANYARQFLSRAVWSATSHVQDVYFSVSEFAAYLLPELGQWRFLRVVAALLVVGAIGAVFVRKPDLNAFCGFLAAALLISPKSDTHHLALLYPGAALLSLKGYRNGGTMLFWVLYLLGSVWKNSPLTFLSILVLVYTLTRTREVTD